MKTGRVRIEILGKGSIKVQRYDNDAGSGGGGKGVDSWVILGGRIWKICGYYRFNIEGEKSSCTWFCLVQLDE